MSSLISLLMMTFLCISPSYGLLSIARRYSDHFAVCMSSDMSPKSSKEVFTSYIGHKSDIPIKLAAAGAAALSLAGNANAELSGGSSALITSAAAAEGTMPLPEEAYTTIGDMSKSCRILNGMWQVSGAHGYTPITEQAVSEMTHCANEGFQTFDLADIYGPAEGYVGAFKKGKIASSISEKCHFYTKWVTGNSPAPVNAAVVEAAISRSLKRMNSDRLDLLQFHWWDYSNKYYYNAMSELMKLKDDGLIRNLALCNFDTKHMLDLIKEDAPLVSNQVSFSIIDDRPLKLMVPASKEHNIQLLVYGTLLGGFLTDTWLDKSEPNSASLANVSLRKYLPWIQLWGGWDKFQSLLRTLHIIAQKHSVTIANVATKWVLQQPQVGGVILGVRLGYSEHLKSNAKTFSFTLDTEDMEAIQYARRQAGTKDLMDVLGDCGGEYRRRA